MILLVNVFTEKIVAAVVVIIETSVVFALLTVFVSGAVTIHVVVSEKSSLIKKTKW